MNNIRALGCKWNEFWQDNRASVSIHYWPPWCICQVQVVLHGQRNNMLGCNHVMTLLERLLSLLEMMIKKNKKNQLRRSSHLGLV